MSKRPLLRTAPVSEFGEFDGAEFDAADEQHIIDNTYVPGWSEMKKQRDVQLGELAQGRLRPDQVKALPVNVRLVRRATASGAFEGKKLMSAANSGYQPITEDMVETVDWFTAMPPGAKVLEDGSIVNAAGDMQYMYCPGPRAAMNLRRKNQRMLEMAANAGVTTQGGVAEQGGDWGKQDLKDPLPPKASF